MDRLQALHAFVRLSDLGTFSAVADDLRVKQSTVSKWVASLEEELGVQLVERTTRSQRLTEAGRDFRTRALDVLSAYDAAVESVRSEAQEPIGRLRVSLPVVFGRRFVLPFLPGFAQAHPRLELELLFDDRYSRLVDDEVDVAIRVGTPVDSSFRARTLGRSARRVVAAPSYLTRVGPPERPGDLVAHDCLLHTGLRPGEPWVFSRDGEGIRVPVRGRARANNSEALLTMAREGLGIALLADWLVADDVGRGTLQVILSAYETPPAPIQAVFAAQRYVHPRSRLFVDALESFLSGRLATETPASAPAR